MQLARRPIAGVDEAGRGPWAGPVVAAAVILDPERIPDSIDDCKVLDEEAREYPLRAHQATSRSSASASPTSKRIDRHNILDATHVGDGAGRRAAAADAEARRSSTATARPSSDARRAPSSRATPRCLSIAAASIIAKVTRDRLMMELGAQISGLRLRAPQGLRHRRAPGRDQAARRDGASPALVPRGAAGPRPRQPRTRKWCRIH